MTRRHAVALSLIGCVLLGSSFRCVGRLAQTDLPAAPVLASDSLQLVLQQGRELEQQQRWGKH